MSYIKIHAPTEVAKALKGKKTQVPIETLFHVIAPTYIQTLDETDKNK